MRHHAHTWAQWTIGLNGLPARRRDSCRKTGHRAPKLGRSDSSGTKTSALKKISSFLDVSGVLIFVGAAVLRVTQQQPSDMPSWPSMQHSHVLGSDSLISLCLPLSKSKRRWVCKMTAVWAVGHINVVSEQLGRWPLTQWQQLHSYTLLLYWF